MLDAIKAALLEAIEANVQAPFNEKVAAVQITPANRWIVVENWLKEHSQIKNADLQRILGVSTATASRMLREWTAEGKLRKARVGSYWSYMLT